MSELDVHVQKCGRCAWEISLSGTDAHERGLVSWMAHVAALHPEDYRHARAAVQEHWDNLRAKEARIQDQWLCAEEGHGEIEYSHDSEPMCTRCGAIITIQWLKSYYEAGGHQVRITEDGKGLVIGSGTCNPHDGGKTLDVDLNAQLARQVQALVDGFAPALLKISMLVSQMLAPPAEHAQHLRDKLAGKGLDVPPNEG